jgi:integrase
MAIFERPAAPATDPRPLSRDDLHVLLDAAVVKMRAAILLALNVAAYPSEVVGIKKSELDLDAKHYVGRRNKTGITRIAVLWDRTVKAVREYMQAEPHDGETLFVNAVGAELTQRSLTQQFRDLRRRTGLGDEVRFDSLRDGAYTAAIEGGATIDEARMLAGHRVGIPDHYLRRKPSMVAAACKAIEDFYFDAEAAEGATTEHAA